MTASPVFVGSEISREDFRTMDLADAALFIDMGQFMRTIDVPDLGHPEGARFCGIRLADLALRRVWYHLGSFEGFEFHIVPDDTRFDFVRRQVRTILTFIEWWISENTSCIDKPANQRIWSNKPIQLSRLQRVFPRFVAKTGVTSIHKNLVAGNVVKHISESRCVDAERSSYASIVSTEVRAALCDGDALPVMVQTNVAADLEYRTYVFGQHHVTIVMPRMPAAALDLHLDEAALGRATHVETPSSLVAELPGLQAYIDLKIFSIDWVIQEDTLQLLEINVLSSWSWLPAPARDAVAAVARRCFLDEGTDPPEVQG